MRFAPLALVALLLVAPSASAHAVLQSADPPVNGHADVGVAFLEIRFTEDVEHRYTDADVIDVKLESWKAGPIQLDPDQKNVVRMPVRPLADGIYSVSWQTLSVDTHTARGSYLFSVGNATLQVAPDTPAHEHGEHTTASILKDGFARFAFYAGLFLCLGVPLFALAIDRDRPPARRLLVPAAVFGVLGALCAGLLLLFLSDRTSLPLADALRTEAGKWLLLRGVCLAAAALTILTAAFAPPSPSRALLGMALVVGGFALAFTAAGSHAAADRDERALSIVADGVHLLMGALWIGGVFSFVVTAPGRTSEEIGHLVLRFSPLAVGSVVLILATGTYASLRHIPRVSALWTDLYGRLVVVKVLLLGPLVLMGAYNKQVLGPRLVQGTAPPRTFRRIVAVEALVMVLILSAAGILASTPPPDQVVEQGSQGPSPVYAMETATKTTHVLVGVRPNPPAVGLQRITVSLHPLTSAPLPASTQVAIKVAAPGEGEPETLLTLDKSGPNDWTTNEDSFFTTPGKWTLYVIVQRPDEYTKLEFEVPVGSPGQANTTGG